MVIVNDRIVAAGVQFPIIHNDELEGLSHLGARHRAALGLSNESDATIIIISEETGQISIAQRNKLTQDLSVDELREHLSGLLVNQNLTS